MPIILKAEVFSTDPYVYTPAELKARDRELALLEKAIESYAATSHPLLIAASGHKASGKSITFLRFIKNQNGNPKQMTVFMLKPESTMRDALATCPLFHGLEVPRTLSTAIHMLTEQVEKMNMGKICLVIDDAQRYNWADLNDALRFFYEHGKSKVLPALVFNIPIEEMRTRIQLDVQSRYAWGSGGTFPIGFHAYNFNDMYHIILQRAEEGLKPRTWTEGAIEEATNHGISVGDVRQAISMLRVAAEQVKTGVLGAEEMRAALEKGNIITLTEDVNNLSIVDRLYLFAITLQYLKEGKSVERGVSTAPVDDLYEKICKALKIKPMTSRTTRWQMRSRLQREAGLVTNEYVHHLAHLTDGTSRRGSSVIVKLIPNPKLLLRALKAAEWGDYIDEPSFSFLFKT